MSDIKARKDKHLGDIHSHRDTLKGHIAKCGSRQYSQNIHDSLKQLGKKAHNAIQDIRSVGGPEAAVKEIHDLYIQTLMETPVRRTDECAPPPPLDAIPT